MFYKRFREVRKEKGLTQTEVARELGIVQTQYSRYERGVQEFPLHCAVRFSKVLGCSLDYLVEVSSYDLSQ